MANQSQLSVLMSGPTKWNAWRILHPAAKIDLSGADLGKANLRGVELCHAKLSATDLRGAVLTGANLSGSKMPKVIFRDATLLKAIIRDSTLKDADLKGVDLRECAGGRAFFYGANLVDARMQGADFVEATFAGANLKRANLTNANLSGADLFGADLRQTVLRGANLSKANLGLANLASADLSGATLQGANLAGAQMIQTNLDSADISGCRIYGVSAWGLHLNGTIQNNLIITNTTKVVHPFRPEPVITVDNLEVAQFVYLLLNNEKVRDVLDTISTKAVLILGRFTPERKDILDAIREELRRRNFVPILFDFEKPTRRDITETVSTLAHMAKFIIADLTDAKSIPQELQRIVPDLPSVPVQPILHASDREYGMFEHFKKYPWVLAIHRYGDSSDLLADLSSKVIAPAEAKAKELNP